ncbi:hypothetical protein [Microbacterium sp. 179-I 3D3 NHS]|uniref:hypothetical protein n=1 Tax=Microbacterium sp. 179-I 3D3 NHS TaxID=3142382 RepID=UPI0039A1D6E3
MMSNSSCSVALLVVVVTALVGCAPAPAPSPTASPVFASEEEAFAAAEEVYREYNDAGNARIAGKDSPDPQDYLIGEALEADIDGERYLEEQGLRLTGSSGVATFRGLDFSQVEGTVRLSAIVCLNVSGIRLLDASDNDVTPAERPDIVAQTVELIEVETDLRISAEAEASPDQC